MKYKKLIKKILFFSVILFTFLYLLYILNHYSPSSLNFLKKIIPQNIVHLSKKTIFFIPTLIKENNYNEEKIKRLESIIKKKDVEFFEAKHKSGLNTNTEFLPNTQFLKLNFQEIAIKNLEFDFENKWKYKVSKFFVESIDNKIIIFSKRGSIFYFDINKSQSSNIKLSQQMNIPNNLPNGISAMDTFYHNKNIYISFETKKNGCAIFGIYQAKLNFDFLNFQKLYENPKCLVKAYGGRMAIYKNNNIDQLLVSMTNQENPPTNVYATMALIDLKLKSVEIISEGHRNPQGLLVTKDNTILQTEHGPKGGDEINKIIKGKNYGWPTSSYGERPGEEAYDEEYFYKKNHKNFNFVEPIYAFVPSIAISQIIHVEKKFSNKWKNNFLITTLRDRSIYRTIFDEKFTRVVSMEKIYIGKRIRDIAYNNKNNFIILAMEDENGSLGFLSTYN